jgi:aspartyl-tRNA(Asn)/glutamyl-tRNA(Gln) amidotransferase subunit A
MTSKASRVEAVLADIGARNTDWAIYIHIDAEGALAAARASDARHAAGRPLSPIDGMTLAVKDNIDVAGMPTTAGLGFRRGQVATRDAFVVARLRAAGAVILGKANMHPAAFGATNRNADFGNCINPTHPGLVPGGSSGGSAAAVAAGWADFALGSDTMGSVRIPASYCGTAGIKPSAGAISGASVVPLCARLDNVGLLARDVETLKQALPLAAGFDAADPYARAYSGWATRPVPRRLRAPATPFGTPVDAAVWARFEHTLADLASRGHAIKRFDPPACELSAIRRAGLLLSEAEMLVTFDAQWRAGRDAFPGDMAAAMAWAEGKGSRDMARALVLLETGTPLFRRLLGDAECLLLPTAPQLPFSFDATPPANQADLTVLGNVAGAPGLSLPMPCAEGELSCGLQVLGAPGEDMAVLELGMAIQASLSGRA